MAAIRRRVLAAGSALLLAACQGGGVAPPAREALHGILVPVPVQPFHNFAAPAAIAVRGADVFVADAGLDALFHWDSALQTVRRIGARRAPVGTKLAALEDGTLYVLDPTARELARITPEGRVLQRLQDPRILSGVADFAVDAASGRLLLVARGRNRLIAVSPALATSIELAVENAWTIASGPDAFYVVDRSRHRVLRFVPEAGVTQVFGETVLKLPGAVAVDRYRRVFIHDAAANAIIVFRNGAHIATLEARALGVASIADFSISGLQLALAGAGGVRLLRVLPPRERE